MAECKYCTDKPMIVHGYYASLEIDAKIRMIFANGDGEAWLEIHYCPICGRKLDESK